MNVTIDTIYVSQVKILLEKNFNFNEAVQKHVISYGKDRRSKDELVLILKYNFSLFSETGNGKLEVELSEMSVLSPIERIGREDLNICLMSIKERLSNVIMSLFKDTQNEIELDFSLGYGVDAALDNLASEIRLL